MKKNWKIIIVDDDLSTHKATIISLKRSKIYGRKIEFINAYSVKEAIEAVRKNPEASIMIVDIVMEDELSGMKLVNFVRTKLKNKKIRIIIRSGFKGVLEGKGIDENAFIKQFDITKFIEKDDAGDLTKIIKKAIIDYKIWTKVRLVCKFIVFKVIFDILKRFVDLK